MTDTPSEREPEPARAGMEMDERQRRLALLAMLEDMQASRAQIERARKEWVDAFDAVRDPIFIHDREFRVVRANRAYAEAAGMVIKDVIGKRYWEVFPKNTGPLPACSRHMEKAEEEEEEEVKLDTDQTYVSRAYAIRDEQGRYLHSIHIFEDITERKRTEQALRDAEERYRTVFTEARDGIGLTDAETGLVTDCNPEFERQCGRSRAQLKELHIWELRPPELQDAARRRFEEVKATGHGSFSDLGFQRPDGTFMPIEVMATRIRIGNRDYLQSISRDITERRRAEEELRKTNRALKTLGACNAALVKATDELALLQNVCLAIVDVGGYRLSWVGYAAQDEAKTVAPQAAAGVVGLDLLQSLHMTWDNRENGWGPTSRAIRTGQAQVVQDIADDPGFDYWRALAREHGIVSAISLPLCGNDACFGALSIYAAEPDAFDAEEVRLLTEMTDDLAFGIQALRTRHAHLHHEEILRKSLEDSIAAIATTVEVRDPYTAGHQRRVAALCAAIARDLRLAEDRIHGLRLAATIHDLGKVNIPAEILSKPGHLSPIEFEMIKTHPQVGHDILKDVKFPWPIAQIVLQHHERLDGSGYPNGLKDEQTLLESKILAVADVVEAMVSHRPYRPAIGLDKALAEIEQYRGRLYDTAVVDACLRLFREKRFAFG